MKLALAATLLASASVSAFACSSEPGASSLPSRGSAAAASNADGGAAVASKTPSASGDTLVGPCKVCHGPDLAGSSTPLRGYAAGVLLFAPNLTPDKQTGIGSWNDAQLRVAIREGLDQEGKILCPQMKHYPNIPAADLEAIIATLRAQPAVKKATLESVCPPLKR